MELPKFEAPAAEPAGASQMMLVGRGNPSVSNVRRRQSRKSGRSGEDFANRVLMLGRIRELALYRAEVLRHHGFNVIAPESEAEAAEIIREGDFDVAVLSYTLSDESVQRFAELIRAERPNCPIIAIAQAARPDRRIQPTRVVLGEKGPAELVNALRRVLHHA